MNIMLNSFCNLTCPYCFAQPLMMEQALPRIMPMDSFEKCLEFLKHNNTRTVRIIGGEPLLVPNIKDYFDAVLHFGVFDKILIFSNGTFSEKIRQILIDYNKSISIELLVNINSPADIGEALSRTIETNLLILSGNNLNVDIGVNIYKQHQDTYFFFELAQKLKKRVVRWSYASPKTMVSVCGVDEKLFYQYYQDNIGTVICFLEKASELNITAEIDCASIPTCALLDNQLRQLLLLSPNIFRQRVCRPSIDVLPDLSVVRCFSMAQSKRYSLLDFDSERKIFKQFIYDIDLMQNEKCVKACKDCPIYKKYHRRCGCLTFSSFGGSDL